MATWNERIDNIQARLANLISEEFSGANFYNTQISVSDYNPTIDSDITLTVTLSNIEGDPVEDASVTVTASAGTFKKLNGNNITAAASVTGTTNSNGQFTLTYNCSEWGLVTFSANNKTLHIEVVYDTGWVDDATADFMNSHWKQYSSSNPIRIRRIGKVVHFEGTAKVTNTYAGSDTEQIIGTIPSQFRPNKTQRFLMQGSGKNTWLLTINTNGTLGYARYGTTEFIRNGDNMWANIYCTWFVD